MKKNSGLGWLNFPISQMPMYSNSKPTHPNSKKQKPLTVSLTEIVENYQKMKQYNNDDG